MEGVAVLEVGGHGEERADFVEREEVTECAGACGRGQAAEPGAEDGGLDGGLDGAGPFEVVSETRLVVR